MSEDKTKFDCFTREGEYIATLPNFQQAKMYITLCTTYEGVDYKPHSKSVSVPELKLELSSCPFCGGEAGIWKSSELEHLCKVSCWDCAACSDWENYHDLPKLVEKWNTRQPSELVAACEKPKFDRCEIFVIKACKGHFGTGDRYANARTLIEKIAYNQSPLDDFILVRYLRELLRKTFHGSSVERWEQFTENAVCEAHSKGLFREDLGFGGRYLLKHFNAVRGLRVKSEQPDGSPKTLIDLSISEIEENEIKHALESERGK